jgi:P-type Cu+ transporter
MHSFPGQKESMAIVVDPVCGMEIEESQAAAQSVYKGVAYSFCSEECRKTFEADPDEFLTSRGSD